MIRHIARSALVLGASLSFAFPSSADAATVRTPPSRVVFADGLYGPLDTARWHSGYYRYDEPIDQSRTVANGEHNRYAPEMAAFEGGALHLRMERDSGGSRPRYDAAVRTAKSAAEAELARLLSLRAPSAQIAWARGRVGYYSGTNLDRLTGVTWRSGLIASNAPMVRNGQMVTFSVLWMPRSRGAWPAVWLFDPVRQLELDVMEGNWQRQIVGHRHVGGLPSEATTTIDAPARPYKVSLWIDGATLRWYVDGKPWHTMPSGIGAGGEYHVYMNYAMASPDWAWIGMDDRTTPARTEFVLNGVTVTGP